MRTGSPRFVGLRRYRLYLTVWQDFRRETIPEGKVPQYNENSRAELLTSMQNFRSIFTTAFKVCRLSLCVF